MAPYAIWSPKISSEFSFCSQQPAFLSALPALQGTLLKTCLFLPLFNSFQVPQVLASIPQDTHTAGWEKNYFKE